MKYDPEVDAFRRRYICKTYPERLAYNETNLCPKCIFRDIYGIPCHLLPVTTQGKDCPYFNDKPLKVEL
jgi:hypothetical protein